LKNIFSEEFKIMRAYNMNKKLSIKKVLKQRNFFGEKKHVRNFSKKLEIFSKRNLKNSIQFFWGSISSQFGKSWRTLYFLNEIFESY